MSKYIKEDFGIGKFRAEMGVTAFEEAVEQIHKAGRSAVTIAANEIGKSAYQNLVAKVAGAQRRIRPTQVKGRYYDYGGTLTEGIRVFTWKDENKATAHIYGNLQTGAAWMLRFFDGGVTEDRITKDGYNMGQIQPTYFFTDAYHQNEGRAIKTIADVLAVKISEITK